MILCGKYIRLDGTVAVVSITHRHTESGASSAAFCILIIGRAPLFESQPFALPRSTSSDQVPLRRPEGTPYRCFLPDLTGFEGSCRAGPNLQHRLASAVSSGAILRGEFDPAMADCGYKAPPAPRLARPAPCYRRAGEMSNHSRPSRMVRCTSWAALGKNL